MGSHDGFCCCHILTAAATVGMLQLIVIVLTMSSAGIVLDRWTEWSEWYDGEELKGKLRDKLGLPTPSPDFNASTPPPKPWDEGEEWRGALMEIELAHQIGICAVWLVGLAFYAGAFKYFKAVFVLPNYVLQSIAVLSTLFAIIGLSIRLGDPESLAKEGEGGKEHRKSVLAIFLTIAVIFFFVEVVFLWVIHKFYKYLKDAAGLVFPGVPSMSVPMKPLEDPGFMA